MVNGKYNIKDIFAALGAEEKLIINNRVRRVILSSQPIIFGNRHSTPPYGNCHNPKQLKTTFVEVVQLSVKKHYTRSHYNSASYRQPYFNQRR